jgi:hypothetical protein
MLWRLENNKLEEIWKKMVLANPKYHPGICLEGQRKPTKGLFQDRPFSGKDLNPDDVKY